MLNRNIKQRVRGRDGGVPGLIQELVGGYEIVGEVGSGGQATVFEAIQSSTGRRAALKVLLGGKASHAQARFQREVEILSRLDHPNIVRVYESGTSDGVRWFSMEFVDGVHITEFATAHELRPRDCAALLARAARAVAYAHGYGAIHRDLKPANVLVDVDGAPKVMDFGLAAVIDESRDLLGISETGEAIGTLPYMSPEQVSGQRLDCMTDVYSLGAILYELLAGLPPHSGEPRQGLKNAIVNDVPERPADVCDELWCIVAKALSKDKHRRYATVSAFVDDLDNFLAGRAVNAKADSRFYVGRKWLSRHKVAGAVVAATVALVLCAVVVAASIWRAEHASARARDALVLSAMLDLANDARDDGRVELAKKRFLSALAMCEDLDANDPVLMRGQFRALWQLAFDSYHEGDIARADELREQVVSLSARMSARFPQDALWLRHRGFSYLLEGRAFAARGNWATALGQFDRANTTIETVCRTGPSRKDVALCARWQARACYEIGELDSAQSHSERARNISVGLRGDEPANVEHVLDIVRCDYRLARCLARREQYAESRDALARAMAELDRLGNNHALVLECRRLSDDVHRYSDWIGRKLAD